ncbi:ABC transporter substrate-binding protein [Ancylobacter sonchi]|uniref:ABC transporter substrate-binding protein n=1 Tax=Ancylobacter sonchi TaxID=1937790 RepID=UPI001BD6CE5C|nr:ABC transporter substrate-binding protein [Ancylobacter sonchi]MBS7535275.1 ABC transporter substrate-binding protein [Ancylobacter sonchi]
MTSMTMESLRRGALGACIALVSLVLTAGPGSTAPPGGKDGGTMVVALPGDPPVINSAITTDISSSNISGQVYSTLVRLDANGKVLPSLAKSWDISPDGLTYTFHLYDGIKWHDGAPFSAEDVAWSLWNVNKKYNGPSSGLLAPVEEIVAADPSTVVFKLKYPSPPLLRGLAYFNSSTIVPKHIFDNGQDPRNNPANLKPIGTGPFVFKEYKKGSHIILEKNPNYHLAGLPYLDRVVFQIIPNEGARSIALEKGDIDFIPYYAMPLGQTEGLRKNDKLVVTFAKRMIAGEYMAFLNTREGPLAKKEVRQALYYAMNRKAMLDKAGFGYGKVAVGPVSSEQPIFYTQDVRQYDYDPALANKMLDEAGFPRGADGKRFKLRVSFDVKEGPMDDVARLMRLNFAAVGVDLEIMGMDSGAWRDTAFKDWNFDITMGSFSTGPDPAVGVERIYVCRNIERLMARNASGYCNPSLDEIFDKAGREGDEAKRVELYRQAQKILVEDAPHWWLWDRYYPIAFSSKIDGLLEDPTGYGAFDVVYWKN